MVDAQLAARDIKDRCVLEIMGRVPREAFLPPSWADSAYDDRALPIGLDQTISQPYIVALMTEMLAVRPEHLVLEIGTGSGYQTAVLASLARHVCTVERFAELSETARSRLDSLGFENVTYRVGDGSVGWPRWAPYDRILVTAAAPEIPSELVQQLRDGGRMVLPIGEEGRQRLVAVDRTQDAIVEKPGIAVRFVRLVGASAFPD